jgi:hypothetical protein
MKQAVITGDIIRSTTLNTEKLNYLMRSISEASKIWDSNFNSKSEIFQGDSFQVITNKIEDILEIALIYKTFIRSVDSISNKNKKIAAEVYDARISIGIGKGIQLNTKLSNSTGIPFELSGRGLDFIKHSNVSLVISTDDIYNEELKTYLMLVDALLSKTSAKQCEVLNLKLLGYNEYEIADMIEINQAAVNQRSKSGNWNEIEYVVKRFRKIYGHG